MAKNKIINFVKRYWHIVFLICLSLIPLVWFSGKGSAIINGVDTNFPLDPKIWLVRRFFMWNNISNGGSDFSFAPAGIFFHLIQFIPSVLGFSLQSTEKISLVFWFALIIVNSYIFSTNLLKSRLTRILFVCLYSLNIYMFNSWENVKVSNLSLVASVPLLLHIFIGLYNSSLSKSKASILLVLVSLFLSGAGINPAYFITAISILLIFSLSYVVTGSSLRKTIDTLIFIIGIILVISSYWILPTISFVLRSVTQSSSIGSLGFNNWVDSLSANTSILNIFRLQGAWDWYTFDSISKLPIYLPYVVNYFFRAPFILFSFVIPALALISLIFIDKEKVKFYLPFVIMLGLGVFLGSGTHEPTGTLFRWLNDTVPYFSLFRSPWYIFTPFVTLSLAILTSLFFDSKRNIFANLFVVMLIIGNLIYCYPLITGKIFRPNRPDGFFVSFPSYLFETVNYLKNINSGRIVTYPDDQLEKYKWGYTGVEPVISLMANNETLFSGINNIDSEINKTIQLLYENIRKNRFSSVVNLADKLNATIILEKKDQHTLSPEIVSAFDRFKKVAFGEWDIHFLNDLPVDSEKIFIANNFYYQFSDDKKYTIKPMAVLNKSQHLLNSKDSVALKVFPDKIPAGKIIISSNSQKDNYERNQSLPNITINRTTSQNMLDVRFTFNVGKSGYYSPIMENYDLPKNIGELNIIHNLIAEKWNVEKITDSYVFFNRIYLNKGVHEVVYHTDSNLVMVEDFEGLVDYESKTHQNNNAEIVVTDSNDSKQLNMLNLGNVDISADFVIEKFDFNNPYFIQLDYKWGHGNMPTVYVNQHKNENLIKTQTENLLSYTDRTNFNFYFEPVKTESELSISLAAPFINNSLGTKVLYDNLKVYKVFMNDLFFVQDSEADMDNSKVTISSSTPVKYNGQVTDVVNPNILVFYENYSPDWKVKVTDLNGSEIKYTSEHFTVDSYANAWFIDTNGLDYKFEITYTPQKYFNIGLFITVVSILSTICFYSFVKFKK